MINLRIKQLRELLNKYSIDAYIVPGTDPHQNEYIPEFWQRRKWITGFTGSYGDFALTSSESGLWTDSRYFIQAENELKNTEIILFKLNVDNTPDLRTWLISKLVPDSIVGIDPKLISYRESRELQKLFTYNKIKIKWLETNLIDDLWKDRPGLSDSNIVIHEKIFSGKSTDKKIKETRKQIELKTSGYHIISSLDCIAWLFNLRGNDIEYNPLFLSYAIISENNVSIFLRKSVITPEVEDYIKQYADIFPYKDFKTHISHLSGEKILLDPFRTSKWVIDIISERNKLVFSESPVILLKAVKNEIEVKGFKNAHIRDGTALINFLYWLKYTIPRDTVTEISAALKLSEFRSLQEFYSGPSFDTISAYKEHGAIVHYSVNSNTDIELNNNGLYLLDSGSQYLDGTTDITRTINLGNPTDEEKYYYTYVLKCHIFLANSVFPSGTKGVQLDVLARKFLWDIGEDYGHGTGHGIGSYLNVHETPPRISSLSSQYEYSLQENMFVSIEPGIYKKGKFGIRIENLFIIKKDQNNSKADNIFLCFEPVTLCPFDLSLINKNLLTQEEINYINLYHKKVFLSLKDFLSKEIKEWLLKATESI